MAVLKNTTVSSTAALQLPPGTTAQRPGSPVAGMMRHNSTLGLTEYYTGSIWSYTAPRIQAVTNLISNPSAELVTAWSYSGSSQTTTYPRFGQYSILLPNRSGSGLNMTTQSMPTPIVNNIYYGGRWIFTAGATVTAADLRFEWFIADTASGQLVFASNSGTHSQWTQQTSRIALSSVTAGSWIIRHFTVNQNGGDIYTDGFFIINLTATFGAGNEPSKTWCDRYYDFSSSSFIYYEAPF